MKIALATTVKPASPWNVTLAKLTTLEETISTGEHNTLQARWRFGRELVKQRIAQKGREVLPADLMKLAMEQCGVSKTELQNRIRFAVRYPTRELMSDAIRHYPSWYRMTHEGLIEKSRPPTKSDSSVAVVIRRLVTVLEKAYAKHPVLTRDEVKAIEQLARIIQKLLATIDQNDAKRTEKVS